MGGRAEDLLHALEREVPGLRLVHKEHDALSRLIDRALFAITLGGMREYMTRYTTVLGRTIYVPSGWDTRSDEERYITLRHEAVHLRQAKRMGPLWMGFVYAVPILPMGLAWGRARIEWEAYAETLRAVAEVHGIEAARAPELRAHVLRQFTSAAYGWMWPFPSAVARWIDRELEQIARSTSHGEDARRGLSAGQSGG